MTTSQKTVPVAADRFGPADLLGALGIASVVVVLWLWTRYHGPPSLASSDTVLWSLGLLTGLLAADLMVLQVLLLARVPWVERAFGHDRLIRRHRWIGFAAFWLMIGHLAMATACRVSPGLPGVNVRLWELYVHRHWMLFATVGTGLLVLVVLASLRPVRRRMRYESWHLLHLYAYLGIALSFPHMVAHGTDFRDPVARAYWWALFGSALAIVLLFRVALPLWRSAYHRLRVTDVRIEAPGVVSVTMTGRNLDRLRTRSGQYFIWRFLDGPGWSRGNPYTVSAAPRADTMRITVKAAGDGSSRAACLAPGVRVLIEGPYGTLTAARRKHPRMLMIAAGIGVTPMRALLEDTPFSPGETTFIYRYSHHEHAVFADEIREIADRRGVEVHFLPGRRRSGLSWLPAGSAHDDDAEALMHLVPDIAERDVFACGPPAWLGAVRRAVRRAGVHPDQVHTEDFAW
ncbi:putative ferric reductase [Actinocorallia herbida]|uniref:Putative ferric reductase n=1 Tax=Actinocorallia herbida TaxID=58109 RepID=A0A3N1CTZ1_9ACTN|nr:ferredoxin reductase family protein [Actinocorallia herbida]ROO84695.1 putative ferric reductase [Actinocorallia herbida]